MSDKVELKHGNGGIHMQSLVDEMTSLLNSPVNTQADAVSFTQTEEGQWLTSTDGFSVEPLFFPGGSIGSLAVNGTVNDLSVAGAIPRYLTLNLFIEEGFSKKDLSTLLKDFAKAAEKANVQVIAGDTKVLPMGQVPGILMATTGLGIKTDNRILSMDSIQAGDAIIVSGPLGDHGAAVMLAREEFGLSGELASCCASVTELTQAALQFDGLRFMRDPTRGGLTTVLHDLAEQTQLCPVIEEVQLPIRPQVKSICSMLGYDPLTLASEGRVVSVIRHDQASDLLACWKKLKGGEQAAVIGQLKKGQDNPILVTELGGETYLQPLQDDPLPRIC